ncbi:molybdopterin converting factor subunit 1 [Desertibacillus haloalkaliphilus]|uniref:molybdopterin converting factor subunit 1 n=1 Tax=Desertibacillus haloalkaliphilus TaxID=1328930 RepID=UPI001C26A8F8|nr:molybdopterin converting factor subunit 1 [Desertibacillus haloalkaliphilus]MBU8905030.1 molybdopterin converting factor subunit 1 [Desertibacillus haloalkaliphilus]
MIKVLFFAELEEIVGRREVELEQSSLTVTELKQLLSERYPSLPELERFMVAINEEYGDDQDVIKEGDTVALIPPVSGG